MHAAAQATDQVATHEAVIQRAAKNTVDSDSANRMLAAIEAAIERAIGTLPEHLLRWRLILPGAQLER